MFQIFNKDSFISLLDIRRVPLSKSPATNNKTSNSKTDISCNVSLRERFENNWKQIVEVNENNDLEAEKILAMISVIDTKQKEDKFLLDSLTESFLGVSKLATQVNDIATTADRLRRSLDKVADVINDIQQQSLDSDPDDWKAKQYENLELFKEEAKKNHLEKMELLQSQMMQNYPLQGATRMSFKTNDATTDAHVSTVFPNIEFQEPGAESFYDDLPAANIDDTLTHNSTKAPNSKTPRNALVESEEDYSD